MNYWLHRISHHAEVSYPLLEKKILTIGFSDFANQEFINNILGAGDSWEEKWNQFTKELSNTWAEKARTRHNLWRFIESFKKNDWIVIPSWGTFYIYEIISEKPEPIGNIDISELKDWHGNELTLQDDKLYDKDKLIDIGFYWQIRPIAKEISRKKYADDLLTKKMKHYYTNSNITSIKQSIIDALSNFEQNKPIDLHTQIDDSVDITPDIIQNINLYKEKIDKLRPLSPELEKRIMRKFRLDWNYHSNNIEGNKLTYGETKTFLLHGITAKGKSFKDHLDIKGHNEAILLLEDIVKEERYITENFIRELHSIILQEAYYNKSQTIDGKIISRKIEIGKYKTQPNHVKTQTGEMHYFATPEETPAKMSDLIEWYRTAKKDYKQNEESDYHPVIIAALFHYKFISIHPFDDGNGRLARVLMNLILMQSGFSPVIIKTKLKEDYYIALQEADGGDEDKFVKYIGEQLTNSLELFLKGAQGENIEDETDIDKQIELLKASLKGEKDKLTITKTQGQKIYFEEIKPVIEKIFRKLEKFDDLFFKKEIVCWKFGQGTYVKKKEEYFSLLEKNIETTENIIGEIGFEYKLEEFRKTEKINFNCSVEIRFSFARYNFLKIYSKQNIFKNILIPYDNPKINSDDEISIINSVAKYILSLISDNVNGDE